MNKSESKYFNTALAMNQALIQLLDQKEFEYITIKEVCAIAKVNRSTFYLHYENMNDLLNEAVENIISNFNAYFTVPKTFFSDLRRVERAELIFINKEYLIPYLNFFKNNRKILSIFLKYGDLVNSKKHLELINEEVFDIIFRRFNIDKRTQTYMLTYYLNGVLALVAEWIKNDCQDEIEYIVKIIINCVQPTIKE